MKIVGWKDVDFSTKDGVEIKGKSVHVAYEAPKDHGGGMLTDKFFLSDEKFGSYNIKGLYKAQSDVELLYNKYGKVESVREV